MKADAGWSLYVMCGEEVQMHGGIVRTAFGGLAGQYAVCRCGSAQHGRVDGRNACGRPSIWRRCIRRECWVLMVFWDRLNRQTRQRRCAG